MPSNFAAIRSGQMPEPMLAFPQKDVFCYDASAASRIERGEPVDWLRLKPMGEMKEAAN
jgi:hypothetical protein